MCGTHQKLEYVAWTLMATLSCDIPCDLEGGCRRRFGTAIKATKARIVIGPRYAEWDFPSVVEYYFRLAGAALLSNPTGKQVKSPY